MIKSDDILNILDLLPDDRMNPTLPGTTACAYTGEDGSHCIAGEILFRLGCDLPEFGEDSNTIPVHELVQEYGISLSQKAMNLLGAGQVAADNSTHANERDAWGRAKLAILNEYRNYDGLTVDDSDTEPYPKEYSYAKVCS